MLAGRHLAAFGALLRDVRGAALCRRSGELLQCVWRTAARRLARARAGLARVDAAPERARGDAAMRLRIAELIIYGSGAAAQTVENDHGGSAPRVENEARGLPRPPDRRGGRSDQIASPD